MKTIANEPRRTHDEGEINLAKAESYKSILDSFRNSAIYVLSEADNRILYYNMRLKVMVPEVETGMICHEVLPCDRSTCPLKNAPPSGDVHIFRKNPYFGDIEIFASKIMWNGEIPAVTVCFRPKYQEQTLQRRVAEFDIPAAFVPQWKINHKESECDVVVGQYSESIFYMDGRTNISDEEQSLIDKLLILNHGVGIAAGYFDKNYSISMISELAVRVLNYKGYQDFQKATGNCLLNIVDTEDARNFLRNKLASADPEIWSFPLVGKNGTNVAVRITNAIGISPEGKKMWYLSMRRFSENLIDSLTGGFNRDGFIHVMNKFISHGADISDYALLYANIRSFKSINDIYGSENGDELLVSVYKNILTSKLRPVICARRDSDHFLILVKKDMLDLEQLKKMLNIRWAYGNRELILHAVCGILMIEDINMDASSMIDCARTALESIEDEYVSPYAIYSEELDQSKTEQIGDILTALEYGIANKEFQVYYQPIVDAKTGKVVSAEALVRWITEEHGVVSPGVFIPILEQRGYIVRLDYYIVKVVCDLIMEKHKAGEPLVPISVNLSQMDFFDEEATRKFIKNYMDNPVLGEYLRMEITESAHATIQERQHEFIEAIRQHNGYVYLDDFGTGTASMSMLCESNFNVLKIDMLFIERMVTNKRAHLMVKKTIEMAHELNMKVVAEGVETQEQLDILREMECDCIQGYYFSKPLKKEEFDDYLTEHSFCEYSM